MYLGEAVINSTGHKLEIVRIKNCKDIDVLIDDKYLKKHVYYSNFKRGNVRSPMQPTLCGIGYMGIGDYSSKNEDGSINEAYQKWNDMMKRCYSKKSQEIRRTYKVVEVCKEWHNFQNFAKWFYDNRIDVNEEIHIDKDIIDRDSKIYSPETCCIVPKTINGIFIRGRKEYEDRNGLPTGVVPHHNTYMAQVSIYGRRVREYGFKTPEDAFQWYKTEKEKHIREVADSYKDILPQRTYDVLMNYEVKPYPFTEEELAS